MASLYTQIEKVRMHQEWRQVLLVDGSYGCKGMYGNLLVMKTRVHEASENHD